MRNLFCLSPSKMFLCQFINSTFSSTVTHFTACGQRCILQVSTGWGDCLFKSVEGENKGNHEFLNPIVGFRAVKAAAVAAGFCNVVTEATCGVGVRLCVKERAETSAFAITLTPRRCSLPGRLQVVFLWSLLCSVVLRVWSPLGKCEVKEG